MVRDFLGLFDLFLGILFSFQYDRSESSGGPMSVVVHGRYSRSTELTKSELGSSLVSRSFVMYFFFLIRRQDSVRFLLWYFTVKPKVGDSKLNKPYVVFVYYLYVC